MKVLAFLQNQWFKDAAKVERIYARSSTARHELNKRYLFYRSLTGKRLQAAFGEEWCEGDRVIWEESSPKIGHKSSDCFVADPEFMKRCIELHNPKVILCFGKIAREGLDFVLRNFPSVADVRVVYGPHPAARHLGVTQELGRMRKELDVIYGSCLEHV